MNWCNEYKQKLMNAEEAVTLINSGERVYVGTSSSVAFVLMKALWDRREELENVEITSALALKSMSLYDEAEGNPFTFGTFFMGAKERKARDNGLNLNFTSVHLSQIDIWCKEAARPDVCLFDVSEPDENGYMCLGPSGIALHKFLKESADKVIVQVNKQTSYIFGQNNLIHVSEVDAIIEVDDEPVTLANPEIDEVTKTLSNIIVDQVPEGATIQLGLGSLSTAIGFELVNKNDLGIHSELLSEPMVELMINGNVTNKYKGFMDGKSVFAFALGSTKLYRYLNRNENIYGAEFPFVNDPRIIAKNKKMISINSTMAFDIFGQAASDSLGWKQQSATGGQLDFVRGAQWSEGGKSIIATTSSFIKDGKRISKIVTAFPEGTAITTPRSDIQYVATEYGCVNLKILNMSDRVKAMINLAHPDFRDQLTEDAKRFDLI
ncbi:4-hydroxybutyrate CoA-transferase [Sedimentibacter acidaminivorans]|uniref:4-hydroxybutyrate CoA-transferase n=1 Tax=Sedimentibacter acidaminivorans TaxID=913099 RepID=A0ABS4GBR4_9FIRM|nr:acetyl-CoA hydrolase/transferase C-terminal domain-containing protein [Sedimentibacter acidaminivorans]MBP1925136.1 4-hydroxybutyrate CoA-transferase [Sedimentibacter acidaminivorans]